MKVVVAVLAAGLLLAGCTTDDPKPNYSSAPTTPSASASPSPSATGVPTTGPNVRPGEVPPTPDPLVSQNTAEGAQAFAVYYVHSVDWMYATSQPALLSSFYAEGCRNCIEFESNLVSDLGGSKHYVGSRFTIKRFGSVTNDGRGGASFAVSVLSDVAGGAIVDASGRTVSSFEPTPDFTLTTWLSFVDGKWLIVDQGKA